MGIRPGRTPATLGLVRRSRRMTLGDADLSLLFHGFPDGRTGFGLLLLRAAVGTAILLQAGAGLAVRDAPAVLWISAALGVVLGIFLLVGFLTPIVAVLAGLNATGWWRAIIPARHSNLFQPNPSVLFLAVVAGVVVLLGPGAFSLDARLFGWREIIIPRPSSKLADRSQADSI